ncbi:MAG: lipase secretion chaperone [Desulfobacteraceae bacterium]|nr:lipase secretion chaperone [Desulfobacteraceae bacterium]
MSTKHKKMAAVVGVSVFLLILGYWLFPKENKSSEYIFDNSYKISLKDVKQSREPLPVLPAGTDMSKKEKNSASSGPDGAQAQSPADGGLDLKAMFKDGLINSYTTLKYFKHLGYLFRKSATRGEHLDNVKNYLFSQFPKAEAAILFETYQKYLQCEIDLAEEMKNLTSAKSTDEAIEILKKIQDFRRERLGAELADKLFGADVKAKEYAFRRAQIVGDDTLSGDTKTEMLQKLNVDMWGEDAQAVESHPDPYNRYREKMLIYKKDLDNLGSEQERQSKIKEYRKEFFTPEVVKKLDEVDRQIASEKENEAQYRKEEKQILESTGLTEDAKKQKVEQLQDKMFGNEADAFRREETKRLELEKLQKEHQKP